MDKPIEVGDLVMVVKPSYCCGRKDAIGKIFEVQEISSHKNCCFYCKTEINAINALDYIGYKAIQLTRLKRIPPLSELDQVSDKQTIEV